MGYSRSLANNFWYEFDNTFFWRIEDKVNEAMGKAGDLETLYTEYRQNGAYPEDYIVRVKKDVDLSEAIIFLTDKQLEIINRFFMDDLYSQQRAFEDFGQGVLYDDRLPRFKDRRIHMMDENHRGYRSWHIFNRTAVLLNKASNNKLLNRWLQIDQHVGLASAIHSKQRPNQSDSTGRNPNNLEINQNILDDLRNTWLSKTFDQLDESFDDSLHSSRS